MTQHTQHQSLTLVGPMDQCREVEKAIEADGWRIVHSGQMVERAQGTVTAVDPTRFRMTVIKTGTPPSSQRDAYERLV